jgi:hypothetical protein
MILPVKIKSSVNEKYERMGLPIPKEQEVFTECGFFMQDILYYMLQEDDILLVFKNGETLNIEITEPVLNILRNYFSKK